MFLNWKTLILPSLHTFPVGISNDIGVVDEGQADSHGPCSFHSRTPVVCALAGQPHRGEAGTAQTGCIVVVL